ncbi:MAG TPA: D-aminoacyl-tRNA deacylase [Opitutales bacterium]|nr:D-aminoacyl-tRNA deacylase [Opitutales bacterium]
MRAVIQRVSSASVEVEGKLKGEIGRGLVVLAGFSSDDTENDLQWVARKISQLRIFNDEDGRMNASLLDIGGDILLISQFTLLANVRKGTRPSFNKAAPPEIARPLYEKMIQIVEAELGKPVATGEFGAKMKVRLVNEGPVTIVIDSKNDRSG